MSVRLSCPYCNAGVTLPAIPASRRTECPRCGESFPVHVDEDAFATADQLEEALPTSKLTPVPFEPAGRSRSLLIGVGTAIVVLGLAVASYIVLSRTTPGEPTGPPRPPTAATVPPARVAGLALLPADTSIAIAVQPGPLLAYAARSQADPKQLLIESGVPPRLFATLDRIGLTLEQIDHVAAGIVLAADSVLPRVVLVLSLARPPADEKAFLRQLKATQYTTPDGATRFKGIDLGIPLPIELARLDAVTYVFASDPKDLVGLESARSRGPDHLPGGLRESLGRLSPASVAWAATDVAAWEDRPVIKLLAEGTKKPEIRKRLQGVRAAAAGLALEPDPAWTAAVRGADSAAVRRLTELATTAAGNHETDTAIATDELWVVVRGRTAAGWLRNLLPAGPN